MSTQAETVLDELLLALDNDELISPHYRKWRCGFVKLPKFLR